MALENYTATFQGIGSPPVEITIYAEEQFRSGQATLVLVEPPEKAEEEGEAAIQLLEGCAYEYRLNSQSYALTVANGAPGIVRESRIRLGGKSCGRINPGLYVGTLDLSLTNAEGEELSRLPVEVRSLKLRYRDDYRSMLEFITERCMGLLLQIRSPASARLLPDPGDTAETIAQRFAFLRSLIGSRAFRDAITRITVMPHHRLERYSQTVPVSSRFIATRQTVRQLVRGSRRVELPEDNYLRTAGLLTTVPEFVTVQKRRVTVDTPENRFVKFALQSFVAFLDGMWKRLEDIGEGHDSPLSRQIKAMQSSLQTILCRPFFKEVLEPHILPLGSPVLQRKGGYREILRAWLNFDSAARLCWSGGDDVFSAGKRDVAMLYEYWVFFKLLDIVAQLFSLDSPPVENLISETKDGFGLKLKAGRFLALTGEYSNAGRSLNIQLSYNRTFSRQGPEDEANYPSEGSWTASMRPDYTLTLWPKEFSAPEAESQEIVVHIHFDAKYRVDNLEELFGKTDREIGYREMARALTDEKRLERAGRYRRPDLLKMHAYRDAIRRTAGAYVIYPGLHKREWRGFHEIVPGLGAFPLRPTGTDDDGSNELMEFIQNVAKHVCDRATRREHETYHRYQIQSGRPPHTVRETSLPEHDTMQRRSKPPQEIVVLVVWYQNNDQLRWTEKTGLIVLRMDERRGSLKLTPESVGAHYVLLHTKGPTASKGLFQVRTGKDGKPSGPGVLTAKTLENRYGYPLELKSEYYLAFRVEQTSRFAHKQWDMRRLLRMKDISGRQSPLPFTATLDEVLDCEKWGKVGDVHKIRFLRSNCP